MTTEIEAAYAKCRAIARKQARNFYYAFVALPREKRDAICAVYAFMRQADDLSDNDSLSHAARRSSLSRWVAGWHEALASRTTSDPVFLALLDTQSRFGIPPGLLDQLVEGTAMDLNREPTASPENSSITGFATFEDLYRYCYLVASVVGLVSIRIFGYSDPRAEKLAEETGIAFQLTNILRDVKEDADRGRVYLPLEDLKRYGVSQNEVASIYAPLTESQRQVLALEADRANKFYESARSLLPLICADSRPAMWVLFTIYHRLLQRIERRGFDVFSERVSLPAYEKLWLLGRGIAQGLLNRLSQRSG